MDQAWAEGSAGHRTWTSSVTASWRQNTNKLLVPLLSAAGDGNSHQMVLKQELKGFNIDSVVLGGHRPSASGSPRVPPRLCPGGAGQDPEPRDGCQWTGCVTSVVRLCAGRCGMRRAVQRIGGCSREPSGLMWAAEVRASQFCSLPSLFTQTAVAQTSRR